MGMAGVGAELRRGADVETLRERAMAMRGQGRIEAWLAAAMEWAAAAPRDARALYHQGYAARQLGRAEAAREAFLRAVELAPEFVGARMELGVLLQAADEAAAAAGQFAAVVRLDPGHVQARVNHGAALRKAGRLDEAEAAYAAALELAPDHFELRQNLANLLIDLDRPEEALAHLRRAAELRPQEPEVQLRQGAALQKLGRAPEAYACYRRALAIRSGNPRAYMAVGVLMHETRHLGLAERFFRRAAAADPMESEAWLMLASLLNAQGRSAEAEAVHGEAFARGIAGKGIRTNALMYLNNRDDLPAAEVARQHREWGLRHGGTVEDKAHANTPDPGRRLKVGYLSPDFRGHSVSYFLMPLIEGHDRSTVELHAYAHVEKPDDKTARYRELFDHWRDVRQLDDAALARLIEADGIDILVELAGHTAGSRLSACALRPAPVQVSWLGYPNTTGLPAIGWRLVDAVTDPPGAEALAVERLCRLPRGFLAYAPSARAPEIVPPPMLQRGHVTFGSFNNAGKLSPAAIACWAELLRALPDARLLLSTRTLTDTIFRRRLRRRFRELGIAAERIDLRPGIPDATEHLATYGEVDIALDPFPYNGTTTTCETLWMGVPVVALRGDRHAGRVGASILERLGLGDLAADTPEAYVATAAALARDPARLAGLRAGLRQRMQDSPLMDQAGFARDVEAAYREIWRDWCERQRPAAAIPTSPPAAPQPEPEAMRAWLDRGAALRKAGRLDEAEAAYAAALELAPDHFELRRDLAELLLDLKRPNEALLHLQRAAALRPGDVEPLLRQAAVLQRLRQPAEAVACYRRALAIEPGHARALLALGIAMQAERRLGLAERLLRRAATADPGQAEAWLMLASVLYDRGHAAEAAAAHGQALARGIDTPGLRTNELLYLNGRDDLPAEEVARRHREWGLRHGGTVEDKAHANTPDPGRRLKVGYLSPDFRGHSVGYFLMPLLEAHDRGAVEIHAYASVDRPDEATWRYRELFDHWRDVRQLDDAALARLIEADGIDILVELAGHTAGSRLSACALRPAPVQVSWLGYPNTTGLPAIDWRLVDAVTDPPGAEALAVERLCRLPRGFLAYAPSAQAPEVVPPPVLQRGHVTFGAGNNLSKLSPATLACWAELLRALPDARLLLNSRTLADPLVRDRLRRRFRELGVEASRLELRPGLADLAGYLATYGEIDIALDPFPYNGTTTSCESLWMGVPVVALAGDRHAGRVAASILHRLGLDDLVAATPEAYAATAAALARDPARLAGLRAGLRQRMQASPLMDKAGFARDVEAAYREMWRDWCERQRPMAAGPARPAKVLPPQPLPAPVAARLERAVRERRWNEAVREAQRVLRNRPDAEVAWRALTLAQRGLGQAEAAVESARRWTAAAPGDGRAFHQLGLALSRLRRTAEARDALTAAVALAPRSAGAVLELGVVCSRLQDNEAAARHFRRVIELEPGHAQAHANLGAMLRRLGRIDEACRVYEAGLASNPDSRALRLNLGNLLSHELCRADEALPHLRRAVELGEKEADPALESDYLLTLNYLSEPGPAEIMAEHVAWGQRLLRRLPPPSPAAAVSTAGEGDAAGRLRIGYLSPDLCSHSVSHFFGPVLAHHDPAAVEIFVYADVEEPDAVTRQLRGLVRHWRSVYGRGDDEVAALIGEDRIDILVEMAGHTKGNRLGLLARRPAPVQVSWLGYPNTTGLPAIDWRLVDAVTDPPGAEALAVERLCRLPRGFLSYGTPAEAPAVAPPPALTHGHVTFGSFNNGLKLNRATIGLWGRILAAVPGSHLLLKGRGLGPHRAEARIRGWLAGAGIAPGRVRMLDRIADRAGHLGLYGEVDIALDPFPYNGTTTTCEALWMGVPVVSLLGDRHAGRVGASILQRIGLGDLVAESEDDYLAKTVALAADPGRLADLRAGMRQRMRASPLCDGRGLARDLEAAYREIRRRHAEGEADGALDMAATPAPGMRLHIGGKEPKAGWTILNILPGPHVDLLGSCTDLGAVADGTCELVYASHVLEHLGYDDELPRALRECRRVLRPGGRLHVSVPDLAVLAELVLRPDLDAAQRFEVMRMIYGGQVDAHDFHKAGFTWEIMEGMLQDAGFTAIQRIDEHDFFNDTSRYATYGRKISLNVAATRP